MEDEEYKRGSILNRQGQNIESVRPLHKNKLQNNGKDDEGSHREYHGLGNVVVDETHQRIKRNMCLA